MSLTVNIFHLTLHIVFLFVYFVISATLLERVKPTSGSISVCSYDCDRCQHKGMGVVMAKIK